MKEENSQTVFQAEHRREADLINNRVTWLLVTQTVLLSVLSIGGGSSTSPPQQLQSTVRCVIPWIGLWVTICLLLGISGAYTAMRNLEQDKEAPPIFKAKQGFPRRCGQIASIGTAIGMFVTWLYILLI
jgi:hypothetical protein